MLGFWEFFINNQWPDSFLQSQWGSLRLTMMDFYDIIWKSSTKRARGLNSEKAVTRIFSLLMGCSGQAWKWSRFYIFNL